MKSIIVAQDQAGRKCRACGNDQAWIFGAGSLHAKDNDAGELNICTECFEALYALYEEAEREGYTRKEYHGV